MLREQEHTLDADKVTGDDSPQTRGSRYRPDGDVATTIAEGEDGASPKRTAEGKGKPAIEPKKVEITEQNVEEQEK